MKLNIKKLIKKVLIIAFAIYFIVTVYNQQKTLTGYKNSIQNIENEINKE